MTPTMLLISFPIHLSVGSVKEKENQDNINSWANPNSKTLKNMPKDKLSISADFSGTKISALIKINF